MQVNSVVIPPLPRCAPEVLKYAAGETPDTADEHARSHKTARWASKLPGRVATLCLCPSRCCRNLRACQNRSLVGNWVG